MNLRETVRIRLIESDINTTLKRVASEVANKLHCSTKGSCIHFAEIFINEIAKIDESLLEHFYVIEGYVDEHRGVIEEHTWIELANGEKIDPTVAQFGDHDGYTDKVVYKGTGHDYLYNYMAHDDTYELERKQNPTRFFK